MAYNDGKPITDIATEMNTTRPLVGRVIDKALAFGPLRALQDLSRTGQVPQNSDDAKNWLLSVACSKPKDFGFAHEIWTYSLLAQPIRSHCNAHKLVLDNHSSHLSRHRSYEPKARNLPVALQNG
ncbi:MAG: hypothetical protein G8345_11005 [Magnetococcales bacterium]|nr:hypothetical protein [Magnetococcales bacterium]NGZ27401.1 hypothetical protein [Magnetococcales bacterium]